ncbi:MULTISPECIES: hypothetical protein [unclassified Methylobacterium]|uniref:hypothetical protein n=1 Tax=unclassified Methylobacterium TaxID=2615210 RepID=UPI001FB9B57A|nr:MULTISPECIES: hypothetical protein [unclassified Methylobacterium]MCJ2018451.1 hypothetical protein [Methylobacterium sp. E-065]
MLRAWTRSSTALTLIAGATAAAAMPMGGTFTMHYDNQTMQPIAPGQMRIEERGSGLNKSPGQPFDNAQVTIVETVTMDRGQGPVKGTITFSTPDGTSTSPYTGRVNTDAQGRMTATGTFKVGKATGAFAGLKGTGAFTTVFASPTDQTTAWSGAFTPPPARAARR